MKRHLKPVAMIDGTPRNMVSGLKCKCMWCRTESSVFFLRCELTWLLSDALLKLRADTKATKRTKTTQKDNKHCWLLIKLVYLQHDALSAKMAMHNDELLVYSSMKDHCTMMITCFSCAAHWFDLLLEDLHEWLRTYRFLCSFVRKSGMTTSYL